MTELNNTPEPSWSKERLGEIAALRRKNHRRDIQPFIFLAILLDKLVDKFVGKLVDKRNVPIFFMNIATDSPAPSW